MRNWNQFINVRISLVIASLSILLVTVTAVLGYYYKLNQQNLANRHVIEQIGASVERTAAISAYLNDEDLALEIVNGLVLNDLIKGVILTGDDDLLVKTGDISSKKSIVVELNDPFSPEINVGVLQIFPDDALIVKNARKDSFENAVLFTIVSLFIAASVGVVVHLQLTSPLRRLTTKFEKQSDLSPERLKPIDIAYPRQDELGQMIKGINVLVSTVQAQFSTEQQLRQHYEKLQHHFKLIFEQASAGIGIIDGNNKLITKNPAFEQLCPSLKTSTEFLSIFEDNSHLLSHLEHLRQSHSNQQVAIDLSLIVDGNTRVLHCLFARISGERSVMRNKHDVLIEVIAHDITERIDREKRIKFEADHDLLTGLNNRRAFLRKMAERLDGHKAGRHQNNFALLMIDLDKFKPVNDTYGHEAGDKVLRHVGEIITTSFESYNSVCCRWGGDEFIIGFEIAADDERLATICKRLIHNISQPLTVASETQVTIGASIGVVHSADFDLDIQGLMNEADKTMYEVKEKSRGDFLIAKPDKSA
ncbi:diguanylate cyclase domain-containing protein [Glaciecola sp. 1036]|uniref:sensor domain-containing diguanylate cyclase n=1 Tax=Alteromonadaceae TaxID=72275 RepID=UPI003D05FCBF